MPFRHAPVAQGVIRASRADQGGVNHRPTLTPRRDIGYLLKNEPEVMPQPIILVVDPNPLTHRRVVEALSDLRHEIVQARDAQEATTKAASQAVILTLASAVLPKGNGYDLARSLRAKHPGAPVYLLSGGFEVYNADRAKDAGVAGHFAKPINAAALRAEVAPLLSAKSLESASAAPEDGPEEVQVEPVETVTSYAPPTTGERLATFLPRDYAQVPLVRVDPAVVGPAMERAILEVLPEVVEVVLRRALHSSQSFRDLVETAVDDAVRAQLPALAERLVAERIRELEARRADDAL